MMLKIKKTISEKIMIAKLWALSSRNETRSCLTSTNIKYSLEEINNKESQLWCNTKITLLWLVGFYGISTFVGYLTLNPFLCK